MPLKGVTKRVVALVALPQTLCNGRLAQTCGIETVAMEATESIDSCVPNSETQGLEVKLINARHVKTVPGRKSDAGLPMVATVT